MRQRMRTSGRRWLLGAALAAAALGGLQGGCTPLAQKRWALREQRLGNTFRIIGETVERHAGYWQDEERIEWVAEVFLQGKPWNIVALPAYMFI